MNDKPSVVYFVEKENGGLFMIADWGLCDTIEDISWTTNMLMGTEFTEEEKTDLDHRYKNEGMSFAKSNEGEWVKYTKIISIQYYKVTNQG